MAGEEQRMTPESSQQAQAAYQGFTGTVSMELTDLIQMLCLSRSDLIIRVSSSSGTGIIYVKEGQIHHAQTEALQGESAFFEIIGWRDGHFEMIPFRDSGVQSVKKAWEHLLIEAMRLRDEGPARSALPMEPAADVEGSEDAESGDLEDRIDQVFDELEQIAQAIMEDRQAESGLPSEASGTVKVLVVDDSPFFSKQVKKLMEKEPCIEVVATAKNGQECLEFLSTGPAVDLITLDIHMPVMPGDTALKHIMIRHPIPVLILSSFQAGSLDKIFEFLRLGAVDFASKPEARDDIEAYGNHLRDMVKRSAGAQVSHFKRKRKSVGAPRQPDPAPAFSRRRIMVILGAEGAYMDWFRLPLSKLARSGLVIGLQKIPEAFLSGFCRLLEEETGVDTVPITDSGNLLSGRVNLGNAGNPAVLKVDVPSLSLAVEYAASPIVSWNDGVHHWLDRLSSQAGSSMSVYFLSSAEVLPDDLIETLLANHNRLIMSPRDTVICTQLVDKIESLSKDYPEQILWGTPDNLMEVW